MKKIKLNPKKLQLNKEKISKLTNDEMNQANGGNAGEVTIVLENPEIWRSHIFCNTNGKGCKGDKGSQTCKGWICFPL